MPTRRPVRKLTWSAPRRPSRPARTIANTKRTASAVFVALAFPSIGAVQRLATAAVAEHEEEAKLRQGVDGIDRQEDREDFCHHAPPPMSVLSQRPTLTYRLTDAVTVAYLWLEPLSMRTPPSAGTGQPPAAPMSTPPFSKQRWRCLLRAGSVRSASSRLRSEQASAGPRSTVVGHRKRKSSPARWAAFASRRRRHSPIGRSGRFRGDGLVRRECAPSDARAIYRSLSRSVLSPQFNRSGAQGNLF